MTSRRFYEDELAYLREVGAAFARDNPKLAPFLGEASRDPDVERLLEGFAFLTGRLRERIEADLPGVSQGLISLLWPNFLRPFPSACVIAFEPSAQAVKEVRQIPAGVEIDAEAPGGGSIRFATCAPLELAPVKLTQAAAERRGARSVLTLTFKLLGDLGLDRLALERLQLYLSGADQLRFLTFKYLHCHLSDIVLQPDPDESAPEAGPIRLGREALTFPGFAEGAHLLPSDGCEFEGFRLLRDYYLFPDKCLFVTLNGLERLADFGRGQCFQVQFWFSEPVDSESRLNTSAFAVNAVPAVNVFPAELQPIRLDQTRTEYIVQPAPAEETERRLFAVTGVEGLRQGMGGRRRYTAFESFHHAEGGEGAFYRTRLRPGLSEGEAETYLSFWHTDPAQAVQDGEVISLEGLCTNGDSAAGLQPGRVNRSTRTAPSFATFKNITQTTRYAGAPIFDELEWQLVSNLALNYTSFANVEALRKLMSTFNVRARFDRIAARDHELMMAGLLEATTAPADRMHRGLPIRGFKTDLLLRQANFAGEGDLYLFATVLRHFLGEYADINSFHLLKARVAETNEIFEWPMIQRRPSHR